VTEAEHVRAVVRHVDHDVVDPRHHGVEQHAVPVPSPAARPDLDALLHQRLLAAAAVPLALADARELEVDGVRGGELLRTLDEGRRLVLVVGALRLCQQLADLVDQAVALVRRRHS
jgi:hypothetical protein